MYWFNKNIICIGGKINKWVFLGTGFAKIYLE